MKKSVVNKKKRILKKNVVFMTTLFFATLFMCIGYASFNSIILDINSSVTYKTSRELLIVDVNYLSNNNADIKNSTINNYYKTTMDSTIKLNNNGNSSITYEVFIKNNTDDKYMFDGVKYLDNIDFYDNPNIDFLLDGINVNDIIYPNESKRFKITFKYKEINNIDNEILHSKLNFKFRKIYDVEYQNMEIKKNYPCYAFEDEDFTLVFEENINNIYIEKNDIALNENEYSFDGTTLRIQNINGDLIIKKISDVYLSSYIKNLYKEDTKKNVLTGNNENIVQAINNKLQMDSYNNIRYFGTNPNNYLMINNELWRIIGVFDDIENDKNQLESRIKIIKENSIGTYSYSYDENDYFGGSNYFINSDLKKALDLYYNNQSGLCLSVSEYVPCDFSTNGFSDESKNFVGPARFYLGSFNTYDANYYANEIYNFERNNPNFICENGEPFCPRLSSFVSPIALIYPSDYLYAVDFNYCKAHDMYSEECTNNNYLSMRLKNNGEEELEYLLNSSSNTDIYTYGIYHNWHGMIGNFLTSQEAEIRPTMYLNSDVIYVSGTGSKTNPYKIDNESKHTISYENIKVRKSYPKEAYDKEKLIINFYDEIPTNLNIYQNEILLKSGYTFNNNTLTINSVTGNIKIEVVSSNKIMVNTAEELISAINTYANSSEFVDIILTNNITINEPIIINQGQNLTIDLNNYKITNNSTDIFRVTGGNNITIKGSGESSYSKGIGIIALESFSGILTIDGFNVETVDDVCIRNQSTSNGKMVIKNCNLYAQKWAGISSNKNNIIDVYDTTAFGNNYAVNSNGGGTINIYSGEYTGRINQQSGSKLNIYGGIFTVNVPVSSEYQVTRTQDNKYEVSLIK